LKIKIGENIVSAVKHINFKTNTMRTFKKAQVIRLSTSEKSLNSVFSLRSDKPYLMSEQNSPFKARIYDTKDLYHTYFNLYIISDDEIKLFDWVYNNKENIVEQITSKTQLIFVLEENKENQTFKKIIATTDISLIEESRLMRECFPLTIGQPSQQFIENYIEEYNRGNIITDVLVEYEEWCNCNGSVKMRKHLRTTKCDKCIEWNELKINPKDNTITIKKVKDSYKQEEVDRLLDEQASKTTAEILEKFKDYLSKDEVRKLLFKFTSHFDLKRNIEITSEMQNEWLDNQFKIQ
jgi:hypothetical protein